jgi:hypothetical protein
MKILIHYNAFPSDGNPVFEFPSELVAGATVDEALEIIFRQCNVVDGTEWITSENKRRISRKEKGLRSMCVDDVVVFWHDNGDWEAHRCAGCGWKLIGSNISLVA